MLIFDAHLDMAWNALEWNRDLIRPVREIREFEQQFTDIIPGEATTSWSELRRGRVGMTICTLLPRLHRRDQSLSHFQSREAAYGACFGQLAYYRAMVERGVLREIPDRPALEDHVAEWEANASSELPQDRWRVERPEETPHAPDHKHEKDDLEHEHEVEARHRLRLLGA